MQQEIKPSEPVLSVKSVGLPPFLFLRNEKIFALFVMIKKIGIFDAQDPKNTHLDG